MGTTKGCTWLFTGKLTEIGVGGMKKASLTQKFKTQTQITTIVWDCHIFFVCGRDILAFVDLIHGQKPIQHTAGKQKSQKQNSPPSNLTVLTFLLWLCSRSRSYGGLLPV